jgi:hypothetical protein
MKGRGQPKFGATPLKWMPGIFPHVLLSSLHPLVILKTNPKPLNQSNSNTTYYGLQLHNNDTKMLVQLYV